MLNENMVKKQEILTVSHLCKNEILKDVSYSVREGEMVAIMGPSGSGKSTLLYAVSGMDTVDGGQIFLQGKELTKLNEDEKARLRLEKIGFVFQQMNMLGTLNIMDNILLPAVQLHKQEKKNAKKYENHDTHYAKELMRRMGIEDLGTRKITEVSGGELQRACICRSMINKPGILFADEPTGALNKSATESVMECIIDLNQTGTTILMVTHDSKVASCAERILYMTDGEIVGELSLPVDVGCSKEERERQVNDWLTEMKW